MVQFLLDAGGRSARPGATAVKKAIDMARERGNFAVVSLLERHARQNRAAILQSELIWIAKNPQEYARLQAADAEEAIKTVVKRIVR